MVELFLNERKDIFQNQECEKVLLPPESQHLKLIFRKVEQKQILMHKFSPSSLSEFCFCSLLF